MITGILCEWSTNRVCSLGENMGKNDKSHKAVKNVV